MENGINIYKLFFLITGSILILLPKGFSQVTPYYSLVDIFILFLASVCIYFGIRHEVYTERVSMKVIKNEGIEVHSNAG